MTLFGKAPAPSPLCSLNRDQVALSILENILLARDETISVFTSHDGQVESDVAAAVAYADELIKQLSK